MKILNFYCVKKFYILSGFFILLVQGTWNFKKSYIISDKFVDFKFNIKY